MLDRVEAVAIQAGKYLQAFQRSQRFTLDGYALLIYANGMDKPLRFIRAKPQ